MATGLGTTPAGEPLATDPRGPAGAGTDVAVTARPALAAVPTPPVLAPFAAPLAVGRVPRERVAEPAVRAAAVPVAGAVAAADVAADAVGPAAAGADAVGAFALAAPDWPLVARLVPARPVLVRLVPVPLVPVRLVVDRDVRVAVAGAVRVVSGEVADGSWAVVALAARAEVVRAGDVVTVREVVRAEVVLVGVGRLVSAR
ncbi:MAG: hypothetical protein IRZ08_14305, partial [Frankia sp.]|nr:hypothetical protein [Frankia sp.]